MSHAKQNVDEFGETNGQMIRETDDQSGKQQTKQETFKSQRVVQTKVQINIQDIPATNKTNGFIKTDG